MRRRPLIGVVVSLAIHAALIAMIVGVHPARSVSPQKRGDALIVELPNVEEPASAGTPGPNADAAPVPPAPPQKAAAPLAPPKPPVAAKPTPPAKAAPREAPRAVARAPQPPPLPDRGDLPSPKPEPETPRETPETATPAESAKPEPPVASAPPSPPGPVAMVPPAPPDLRSAFRRSGGGGGTGVGGAGGTGIGRGGIVGEPIPLDSKDADLNDYLERIKRQIKQNWVFPCIKDRETGVCEYKSTELIVEFGILKPGQLQYVEVRRASPWQIYDVFAVNAVKLASPFPPVPAAMMARMQRGSTGTAIVARFVYHVETGITNVLR